MADDGAQHRLAAIISGDVAGYSRLIAQNEGETVRLVNAYRQEIELLVGQHSGRLVDFTGDNFLAEFTSSLAAVRCAVDIQNVLRARNTALPEETRMAFRLGVHQGEVRSEAGRIFGTGVNVAARLCALAEPGHICTSAAVYEQLRGNLEIECEDLGEKTVKNIPTPVHVYRIGVDSADEEPSTTRRPGKGLWLAIAAGVVVGLGIGGWYVTREDAPAPVVSAQTRPTAPVASQAKPGLGKPSIVVLPFTNMSDDPEQEYFADGITEDLTTDLSRIRELFVISRNSAFTYKGLPVELSQVGKDLGVRYVLEGSVRKAGGNVRITAQLIDAETDFHVWSERYDRKLKDVFALQSELTREILAALKVEIEEAEIDRIRRAPLESLSAYESWMRGRSLMARFSREDLAEGRVLIERAIALDSSLSAAHADLANSYLVEFAGWNPDPSLVARAAPLAQRALDLDRQSPHGYVALAAVAMAQRQPAEAIAFASQAKYLSPSNDAAMSILGMAELQANRLSEGTASLTEAIRLNPRGRDLSRTMLGIAHFRSGRTEQAIELWEQVRNANPDATADRILLAHAYQADGRAEEARALVQEVLQVNPTYNLEMSAHLLGRGGFDEEAISRAMGNLAAARLRPGARG